MTKREDIGVDSVKEILLNLALFAPIFSNGYTMPAGLGLL